MLNLLLTLLSNVLLPAIQPMLPIAWKLIQAHWKALLFDLMILICGISMFSCHSAHVALKTERAAHKADIQTFKDAQAQALKQAQTEKTKLETESKMKANNADQSYHDLLARYNASLMRYQAHSGTSGTPVGGQASVPQGTDGPSESTGLYITLNDAMICADNTARLQTAHDWAIDLQKDTTQ